jgi:deazaflavin-dependent oxidoreductase (nitroreductase family)
MSTQNNLTQNPKTTSAKRNNQKPFAFMIPLMKMPLVLYRLGLGWVFGNRFIQLTHKGRQSGRIYRSVLAVLHIDEESHEIKVVSPWSESNWFKNIQATPALEVETGNLRFSPKQRDLAPEEIAALLIDYRREHPLFSRIIARIPGWKIDSTFEEFLDLAYTLRGVAFQPK